MPSVGSIWFLPTLFWTRISYNWIAQFRQKYLIAVVTAMIATALGYFVISLPTGILEGLSALLFYTIGDSLKEYNRLYSKYQKVLIPLGGICAIVFINYSMLSMCRCWYRNYPLDIVAACFMSWVVVLLSKQIVEVRKLSVVFQWIGINSLTFLCIHNIETHTINYVKWFNLQDIWYFTFPAKVFVCFIVTIILGKIPWFRNVFAIKQIM